MTEPHSKSGDRGAPEQLSIRAGPIVFRAPILTALVLRPIIREKLRTLLTLLGIAVGVAVVVAIELSNQSALRAFRESVDAVAGRANWQIATDAGLDENVLLALQPLWSRGVRFAPVIDVEGIMTGDLPLRILGVDLLSDVHFRDYRYARVETGALAGQGGGAPDSAQYLALFRDDALILPAPFAREHGLRFGSPITIDVGGHRKQMVIRGLLEAKGPATAFNGAIGVVDIATAQKAFGMAGRLSRIDLIVPDGVDPGTIAHAVPSNARLERPSRRNERVEKMLQAFRLNLFALAGVALLVGMFLVYNTVLISILRRRRDVGVFKTLGVSPRQIFAAFLGEGLVFGLAGSLLGLALGYALASTILGLIGRTINALYITSQPEAIALTPSIVLLGVAVGTILSVLSALQPAIEAAGLRPNLLIRPGLQQRVGRRRSGLLAFSALLAFLAGAACTRIPPIGGIAAGGYVAVLFVVIGFSLLSPLLITTASSLLIVPMRRLFGIVGQLASASIPASLRRTAVACAALALATGMMVAVALMVGSFRETVKIWVDQTVSSDLWLRPSHGLSNGDVAVFPASITNDLARIPIIAGFERVRSRNITLGDSIVAIAGADFEVSARYGRLPMIAPASRTEAIANTIATNGVMVSEPLATKRDLHLGQRLAVPTANGIESFPITGIYRDYSSDRGAIFMPRALYIKAFHDDAINTVIIYLKPGVDLKVARRELEAELGPRYHAFVVTNREIRTEVMRIFDQTFLITYALLAVAIVVAVLGIINTLSALILERTRELALLRVLGMTVAEVRRMIVVESAILGGTSTISGLAMGYVLSWILINVVNKQSFGWTIEFHTPGKLIALSLIVTFVSSIVAGLVPARLARHINVITAMKAE
jgi:putative ABC transport system permease protein